MNRRTFILSSFAGVLAIHHTRAQTIGLSDEDIREILRRRINVLKRATGMAVGIVGQGRRRTIVYGKQDSGDTPSIAANTIFEIGSVTKVFTALLLADMVHRHELQFDDPVDRYLPSGFRTPQFNGRAISLVDLATHTSGLPFFPFSLTTTLNPLEALSRFSMSHLQSWLTGIMLSQNPGTRWEYSNVGYGLLGIALANKAGTTYDELLNHRIIGPLRLMDTMLHPTGKENRLAIGHDSKMNPVPPLDLGIFAPAGAIRSTTENLLTFLTALMPDSQSPLEAPARLLTSIHRPASAVGGEQAIGWDMMTGADPFLAKDGVTAGQAATIVLDVSKQLGVVVLSNALPVNLQPPPGGGVGAADLARHLIRPALPLG